MGGREGNARYNSQVFPKAYRWVTVRGFCYRPPGLSPVFCCRPIPLSFCPSTACSTPILATDNGIPFTILKILTRYRTPFFGHIFPGHGYLAIGSLEFTAYFENVEGAVGNCVVGDFQGRCVLNREARSARFARISPRHDFLHDKGGSLSSVSSEGGYYLHHCTTKRSRFYRSRGDCRRQARAGSSLCPSGGEYRVVSHDTASGSNPWASRRT